MRSGWKVGMALLMFLVGGFLYPGASTAAILDITGVGTDGYLNGAFFTTTDQQSTGTGVIEPFLRIQANDTESGYNTDGTLEFDTKSGQWTHALQLSSVPEVTINGITYREFLLDINESNAQGQGADVGEKYLSIDTIEIYLGSSGTLTDYPFTGTASLIFDLDSGGDGVVKTNYALNPGSGAGDLFVYIPSSLFGSDGTQFVYFYSEFGGLGDVGGQLYGSTDGFEEWSIREASSTTPIPEPGTMMLLGSGLVGLAGYGRKKFRK